MQHFQFTEIFLAVIRATGLQPPETLIPGKFTRFPGRGKSDKNRSGWAIQFPEGNRGTFGDWSTGLKQTWFANNGKRIRKSEYLHFKAQVAEAQAKAEIERRVKNQCAADKASAILAASSPASPDHLYLARKGIQPTENLRQIDSVGAVNVMKYAMKSNGELLDGPLLIAPIKIDGQLASLELIDGTGLKHAIYGGARKGGFWAAKPLPIPTADAITILVGEGVATVISAVQATGHFGVSAFSNSNLLPVCEALRKDYPNSIIVVLADLGKADETPDRLAVAAAQAINGVLAVPDFGCQRDQAQTDFNDLMQAQGLEAVKTIIEKAITSTQHSVIPADTPDPAETAPTSFSFASSGGKFNILPNGVFYVGPPNADGEFPDEKFICSPIIVAAKTRNAENKEWGFMLVWKDSDNVEHTWAMPASMLQGDGTEVRRILAGLGVSISPKKTNRDLMTTFFHDFPVETRARCIDQLGWLGNVYITHNRTIGTTDETVVFQNEHSIYPNVSYKGSVQDWRESVAALAAGNSRLVFAIAAAFAGPLLDLIGSESGGFHFRGGSSSGKTTALKAAASVCGHPNQYPRTWRSTNNGLEAVAAMQNDSTMILDELSQMDPKEAGEAAYLLANGRGKARAQQNGAAAKSTTWRTLILSAGEESLTALMGRVNQKTNAGQEIRLADIPSDAGCGMGCFENIHGYSSPADFALAIKDSAVKSYGTVGLEFLDHIVKERGTLPSGLGQLIGDFVESVIDKATVSGQVIRVAHRFGIVAAAGELASRYGLTGWPKGESIAAAKKCFEAWHDGFGGNENHEERRVLSQVRGFFEAHSESRFTDDNSDKDRIVINRVGHKRIGEDGQIEFLVLPEAYKNELCKGLDAKFAAKVLIKNGWLIPDSHGKSSQSRKLPGATGSSRVYVFLTDKMWADEI